MAYANHMFLQTWWKKYRQQFFRSRYHQSLLLLFVMILLANSLYLHRLPGLLGDEASEGYNVYELLSASQLTITGERSYIGPLLDYLRVPFVMLFGYSALALRVPMLLITLLTFGISASLFRRWFGETISLCILAILFLSPVYLLEQRLGWAITLLPFFAVLLIWLLYQPPRHPFPLLAGLVAGIGLSTHILFAPTLLAIAVVWMLTQLRRPRQLLAWWPAAIAFWAGFAMQYTVMRLWTEDQGIPNEAASTLLHQVSLLSTTLPDVLSGSVFIASYTSHPLNLPLILGFTGLVFALVIVALLLPPRRDIVWLWLGGLLIHLLTVLLIIGEFSPRYFVVFALGMWLLAGKGLGSLLTLLPKRFVPLGSTVLLACVSLLLLGSTWVTTVQPFLREKGSTAGFPFAGRTITGSSAVALEPLLACLNEAGPVYSDNVHIVNRLKYLALSHKDFYPVGTNTSARWSVVYRQPEQAPGPRERCPDLKNFRVVERQTQ